VLQMLLAVLRSIHASLSRTHQPRFHFWSIIVIYAALGLYIGVWAVLIADLTNAFKLSPVQLGIALSCSPCTGIVLLALGSFFADRVARRHILLLGLGGLSLFFIMLSTISQYWLLLLTLLYGGMVGSCYDLAINTLGGDYERFYARRVMTLFNAAASGGAALGAMGSAVALAAGINFRSVYVAMGITFLLLAGAAILLPLPSGSATPATKNAATPTESPISVLALLLMPVVLLATTLNSLAFFTDGALEGYTSVYLRNLLGSGALLGGVGIAILYLTGMIGRFISTFTLQRYRERAVITFAATLVMLGMALTLATASASLAVIGLLLVGLGESPIVPTAFSLAAQAGPQLGARAVAIVTAFGYSIFLITPLVIGFVASLTSLRLSLLLTIVTSMSIIIVAQRLPSKHDELQREEAS
jgi:MFS family permease